MVLQQLIRMERFHLLQLRDLRVQLVIHTRFVMFKILRCANKPQSPSLFLVVQLLFPPFLAPLHIVREKRHPLYQLLPL